MRVFRRVIIVVVVLGALLAAVDRVGAWMAEQMVADQVADRLAAEGVETGEPDAQVHGFPFVTQVVAGEYQDVTVNVGDVDTGEAELSGVRFTASDVAAPVSTLVNGGGVHAARIEATGTVAYATVAARAGLDGLELSAGDDGAVAARLPIDVLGTDVVLTGSADVAVDGNAVRLSVTEFATEEPSALPDGAAGQIEQLARDFSVDLPLPALPYDLTVDSVRPVSDGLAVRLHAEDVPL